MKFSIGGYNNSSNPNTLESNKLQKEVETLRRELENANKNIEK